MWRKMGLRWTPPPLPAVWGRLPTELQVALLSSPLDTVEHFGEGGRSGTVTVRFMDGRTITTRDPTEIRVVEYFEQRQARAMGDDPDAF